MKIAVASNDGVSVSGHVGRVKQFVVFEIENGGVKEKVIRTNTFTHHMKGGHTHEHGDHQHGHGNHGGGHGDLAKGLNDCKYLVSAGMGRRLVEDLRAEGIAPVITDVTDAEEAAVKAAAGELNSLEDKACH